MLIYVNGDSFAAGSGLLDHKLVPNYESLPTKSDFETFYKTLTYINQQRAKTLEMMPGFNLRQEEKKISWPSLLSEITGYEVINQARSGSSMESIALRTFLDLKALSNENKVPNIVFIQITHPSRYCLYKANFLSKGEFNDHLWINSIMPDWHDSENELSKYWLLEMKNEDLLMKYLVDLINVNTYVQFLTGRLPFFVYSWLGDGQVEAILDLKKECISIDRLENLITLSRINNQIELLRQENSNKSLELLPCRHYNKEATGIFATAVVKFFEELEYVNR